MTTKINILHLLLLITAAFLVVPTTSRLTTTPPPPTTTNNNNITTTSRAPHKFSLPLHHSYHLLLKPYFQDYKSYFSWRTDRERKRYKKTTKSVSGHDHGHQQLLSTPIVSSFPLFGTGEYVIRARVGAPGGRDLQLGIDTGSSTMWIQCQPCNPCYEQADQPIYDPNVDSQTYQPLLDLDPLCQGLEGSRANPNAQGQCRFNILYGDGESAAGTFATETLAIIDGDNALQGTVPLGCATTFTGTDPQTPISNFGTAGVLPLGRGTSTVVRALEITSFSYCLVEPNSEEASTLEINTPSPDPAVVPLIPLVTPLQQGQEPFRRYYVAMTGIAVAGENLDIPLELFALQPDDMARGTIFDTGASLTYLQEDAYTAFWDRFRAITAPTVPWPEADDDQKCAGQEFFSDDNMPTVTFLFDWGFSIEYVWQSYMTKVVIEGNEEEPPEIKWCLVIDSYGENTDDPTVIGNLQQHGTRVHYDLVQNLMFLTSNAC